MAAYHVLWECVVAAVAICASYEELFLQLRLNYETFVRFLGLPFHSKTKIIFCRNADWLALSCIEVCLFQEKYSRVGLTKIES